jgi:Thrombospondin type 1 domain
VTSSPTQRSSIANMTVTGLPCITNKRHSHIRNRPRTNMRSTATSFIRCAGMHVGHTARCSLPDVSLMRHTASSTVRSLFKHPSPPLSPFLCLSISFSFPAAYILITMTVSSSFLIITLLSVASVRCQDTCFMGPTSCNPDYDIQIDNTTPSLSAPQATCSCPSCGNSISLAYEQLYTFEGYCNGGSNYLMSLVTINFYATVGYFRVFTRDVTGLSTDSSTDYYPSASKSSSASCYNMSGEVIGQTDKLFVNIVCDFIGGCEVGSNIQGAGCHLASSTVPRIQRNIAPAVVYGWSIESIGACSVTCGQGVSFVQLDCTNSYGEAVGESLCHGLSYPTAPVCIMPDCADLYHWTFASPGSCSAVFNCVDANGHIVPDSNCPRPNPWNRMACNQVVGADIRASSASSLSASTSSLFLLVIVSSTSIVL